MENQIKFELNKPVTVVLASNDPTNPVGHYKKQYWEVEGDQVIQLTPRLLDQMQNVFKFKKGDEVTFKKIDNPEYAGGTLITVSKGGKVDETPPEPSKPSSEVKDLVKRGFTKVLENQILIMEELADMQQKLDQIQIEDPDKVPAPEKPAEPKDDDDSLPF